MEKIFFSNWDSIIRTLLIGVLAYSGLIVQLRLAGKRTLSQMNAFDFIVTVALGSTLATVLLSKDVALVDGLLAFAVLVVLQFMITWLSVKSKKVSNLIKATPTLLFFQGRFLQGAMDRERITEAEIRAVIRENGISKIEEVGAIILETEGKMSLIKDVNSLDCSALADVRKPTKLEYKNNLPV